MRLSWISRASFLAIGGSALLLTACTGSSTDNAPMSAASDPAADSESIASEGSDAPGSEQSEAAEPEAAAEEQAAPAAESPGDSDQASEATAETDAATDSNSQAQEDDRAQAQTDTAAVATAVSGAPVPPPSVAAAEFDEERHFVGANFPSLYDPVVVLAEDATWLEDDTLVLGAVRNGDARAYPVFMMTYHHIANDTLGGLPYLVTY